MGQEKSVLEGKISHENEPVIGATVQIPELNTGTTSDENGIYRFTNLPAGRYELVVSAMGLKTIKQQIEITDRPVTLDLKMREDVLGLDEVVITGTRYERSRKEAPVVVSVVDKGLFNSTQSFNMAEGLVFQPGLRDQLPERSLLPDTH